MSRVTTQGATAANPLGFMQRLSPTVSLSEPTPGTVTSGNGGSQADPELILLSTWMGAKESHIAKYVQEYRARFPTSRILAAQCPFTHVVMPFLSFSQIRPAVPIFKALVESESKRSVKDDSSSILTGRAPTTPRVLIHAFSNGGISTTMFLYGALKRSLGGRFTLPPHVLLLDGCPGTFRWRNTARAIMQVLPRWSSPFVHAILFSVWLIYRVVPLLQPRQNINTRAIRNPSLQASEVRRTYLYGSEDKMIPPGDVEREAGLAADSGFQVRLERFEGATHVAIPKTHHAQYWRVVQESWYGEEPATLSHIVVQGDGGDRGLAAEMSSETVTKDISLVDNEKPISEEARILAEDLRHDGQDAVQAVEKTAQQASENAESLLQSAESTAQATKEKAQDLVRDAPSKVKDIKTDVDATIEQGQARLQQLTSNAGGAAKEIDITSKRKSLSKEVNTVVEDLKSNAVHTLQEAEATAKQAEQTVAKAASSAAKYSDPALQDDAARKGKYAERPRTPDAGTALQAALAATSSSPDAGKRSKKSKSKSGSSVEDLAAQFGGTVDKSTTKVPKTKDASPAEAATPVEESVVLVDKPIELTDDSKVKKEEIKTETSSQTPSQPNKPTGSSKAKKTKKNGKK